MIFASLTVVILLEAFWLWMFWDMANNPHLPPCFIGISGGSNPRNDWLVAFIFLNLFSAGYYYLSEYKKGKI